MNPYNEGEVEFLAEDTTPPIDWLFWLLLALIVAEAGFLLWEVLPWLA